MSRKPHTLEMRRVNLAAQWERIHRAKRVLPYLLLEPGPTDIPCPVHAGDYEWLYFVESPYWNAKPLCTIEACRCNARSVGRVEAEKLKREGLNKHPGRPVLGVHGFPTGHATFDRVPLKGIR